MYRETHPTHPSRENLFSRIRSYASLLLSSPKCASERALGVDDEQLVFEISAQNLHGGCRRQRLESRPEMLMFKSDTERGDLVLSRKKQGLLRPQELG